MTKTCTTCKFEPDWESGDMINPLDAGNVEALGMCLYPGSLKYKDNISVFIPNSVSHHRKYIGSYGDVYYNANSACPTWEAKGTHRTKIKTTVFKRAKELTPNGSPMNLFWENVIDILEQDVKEMAEQTLSEVVAK